jgi:hypothetical protein
MTCPYSDGFQCFFTLAQCVEPSVWQAPVPLVPKFPTTLGFCLAPSIGGYINLSITNRANITDAAIVAFVALKETAAAKTTGSWTLSNIEILGISFGCLAFLILLLYSCTLCNKKKEVLTNTNPLHVVSP